MRCGRSRAFRLVGWYLVEPGPGYMSPPGLEAKTQSWNWKTEKGRGAGRADGARARSTHLQQRLGLLL
jgi:hypothetical protein